MNLVKKLFYPPKNFMQFFLGKDNFGFGFGGTGKKSYSSQFDDYGEVI